MLETPNFSERCYHECTKDVLFIFQWRSILLRSDVLPEGYQWTCDYDMIIKPHPTYDPDSEDHWDDYDCPSHLEMLKEYPEYFMERWNSERIYLTREEGEAYGKSRAYNYPEGWRVYGVPSYGKIVDLIKDS